MLENRHHSIILDFNGGGGDERWKVYPLSSESEPVFNYQRVRKYVNSCNGLLFFFDESDGKAYICNPTTDESSKVIPRPPSVDFPPPGFKNIWGCSGLGFDSRSNDYKFIIYGCHVAAGAGDGDSVRRRYVELYSLRNDSWKSLTDFPTPLGITEPCVYADGSIYWVSPATLTRCCSIQSFDFGDETFSSFDINHLLPADSYDVRLVDCGGCLGLVAHKRYSPANCFDVWVKTSTSNSAAGWNIRKRWNFSLPQISINYPAMEYLIILGFSGEILYLVSSKDGEVFAYDCAADRLNKLQISLRKHTSIDPVFISYVETTVSPTLPN